jgi:hypothetical protein
MSTVEKVISVTLVAQVRVRMRKEALSAEKVQDFSGAFWPIAGPDDLMVHAAQRWVIENEPSSIEGIGAVGDLRHWPATADIETLDLDIACEVLPEDPQ